MSRRQIANLIGALLMSALILAAGLLLTGRTATNALSVGPDGSLQVVPLEDYQALQQTVEAMQAREAAYQDQLQAAQQYIDSQSVAVPQTETTTYRGDDDDHERYESSEHEAYEHEYDDD